MKLVNILSEGSTILFFRTRVGYRKEYSVHLFLGQCSGSELNEVPTKTSTGAADEELLFFRCLRGMAMIHALSEKVLWEFFTLIISLRDGPVVDVATTGLIYLKNAKQTASNDAVCFISYWEIKEQTLQDSELF